MSSKLPVVLFLIVVLVASVTVATLPVANALTRNAFNDSHTTARFGNSKVCGDHICAPGEHEKMSTELNTAQRNAQAGRATTPTAPAQTTPPAQNMPQGQNMPQTMPTMVSPMWTTKTGTIASVQDPGQGHENHQLAVILPPSDKIYSGVISWTSSEPLQIVELTGPLGQGDDKGQPIWTTDGK